MKKYFRSLALTAVLRRLPTAVHTEKGVVPHA